VVYVAEREWDFVRDQVAIDLGIMADQLRDGKISTQRAIGELFTFAQVLREESGILPEQETYFGPASGPRGLWLWDYQVIIIIHALEVYRNTLEERLRTKRTIFHRIRCSECRKGEHKCLEVHKLDAEEDFAQELSDELVGLMQR